MLLHLCVQYSFFKSILEWKTIFWLAKKKRGRNPHAHYLSLELLFNSIPALAGFLRFSAWSVSETGCCHKQKGSLWKLSVVRRWVWRATALRQCWLPQNALVNALTPQVRALFLAVMKNGFRRMAIGKINQIDSSLMTQIKTWTSVFYGNKTSSSSLITSFCSWQFLQPPYSPPRSLSHSTDVQEHFWTTELEGDEVFVKAALFDSNSPRHRIQEVWLMQTVSADKRQSRGSLFSLHTTVGNAWGSQCSIFKTAVLLQGGEKIASVTKAVLKTSLKCCVLHPWSSHCLSVGHHSPEGSGPFSFIHIVQSSINHNPFQQSYPCLCWKPLNMALKRNVWALPEYCQNDCPWVQGTHKI